MGFLYMNLHSCSSNQIFSSPWFYFLSKFKIHTHTHTHTHREANTHPRTHTQVSSLPAHLSFNQSLFNQSSPGKVNSSIQVYTLRAFFQDAKSSLTKHKKCLIEAFYGTSETKLEPFTKKVNG